MAEKDYYSFDEVLSDLQMEADQLKRLVSAGEIRAFRDQDTMRFKAADIERLKGSGHDGDELDLDLGEELDLTDDIDLETQLDSGGDELVLEDDLDLGGDVEEVDLAAEAASEGPRRRPARALAAASAEPEQSEGPFMIFLLILGFAVLTLANFAAFGAVAGRTNGLNGFLAQIFA